MLASYKWLTQITGFEPSPQELADKFTFSGLEVDDLIHKGPEFENIVVAQITEKAPHPKRDKLSLVKVDSGDGIVPVVCGAPNCPGPGSKVILAKLGATFGDFVIEPRKLAGEQSEGMLCSEAELNMGPEDDGIIILDEITDAAPGTPIKDALDLEDWIYELGVTPNRPDALSHRGLAKEMCLLFDKPFNPPKLPTAKEDGQPAAEIVHIELVDESGCPRYAAAVMKGVAVKPSPFALRYRLHNLGIRPISNLVDVTNAILLEYGQPLHAFDLDKLSDNKIIVRKAQDGEKMKTLDDTERTFVDTDLLICDGEKPVAVAGVMGGQQSEVTDSTQNILIECAYFDPSTIRRTSKRLKLYSESSYRFERGVDPNQTETVLAATTALMGELAGGTVSPGIVDCYPQPIEPITVILRPSRYEQIMGASVPQDEMKRILEGLGAKVKLAGDNLSVDIPTGRPDMEREIDLIEEVARITGLDKIPAALPKIQCLIPERLEYEAIKRTKEILCGLGLEESITYSFVPQTMLDSLKLNTGVIRIANPLSSERDAMRTTLLAGLLENLKRAESRYVDTVTQFEVGRTFHEEAGESLPKEIVNVAAILDGSRSAWISDAAGTYDFYDIKGIVDSLCQQLVGRRAEFIPLSDCPYLHPQKGCSVVVNGQQVGVMGELHPGVLEKLKIHRGVVGFELDLMLLHAQHMRSKAAPLSEFPPMGRDVAFLVSENQDAGPIQAALKTACGELATRVQLFDIYRGKGIAENKKSVGFSVQYRSFERTLTDEEIDRIHTKAVESICTQFGITTR